MSEISTPDLTDDFPAARAIELQFNTYGAVKQFAGPADPFVGNLDDAITAERAHTTPSARSASTSPLV